MNWKNILSRAAWTFVQAALTTFTAIEIVFDVESIKAALIASAVAGGSALLSFIKTIAQEALANSGS